MAPRTVRYDPDAYTLLHACPAARTLSAPTAPRPSPRLSRTLPPCRPWISGHVRGIVLCKAPLQTGIHTSPPFHPSRCHTRPRACPAAITPSAPTASRPSPRRSRTLPPCRPWISGHFRGLGPERVRERGGRRGGQRKRGVGRGRVNARPSGVRRQPHASLSPAGMSGRGSIFASNSRPPSWPYMPSLHLPLLPHPCPPARHRPATETTRWALPARQRSGRRWRGSRL